jgi:hypothetical protein
MLGFTSCNPTYKKWYCFNVYSKRLELGLFYNITNRLKASPIIKSAPFPSLVGEGQGGVRGEVYQRGSIFG